MLPGEGCSATCHPLVICRMTARRRGKGRARGAAPGRVSPKRGRGSSHGPPIAARSDPDNVVLCLLAADEDDDRDVALQIHFTLIRAFCCENDINILRVSNPGRLAELLLLEPSASPASEGAQQPPDLHCVLVTVRDRVLAGLQGTHGPVCRLAREGEG